MLSNVQSKYFSLLANSLRQSVVVSVNEEKDNLSSLWQLLNIFKNCFPIDSVTFIVIVTESDGSGSVDSFVSHAKTLHNGLDAHIVRERPMESLSLMTLCMHHIIVDSALSFWGLLRYA
jgi:hypothetical protein